MPKRATRDPRTRRTSAGGWSSWSDLDDRPEALSREFESTAQSIRQWVRRADLDEGKRRDGLTTEEREELVRLRRENRILGVPRWRSRTTREGVMAKLLAFVCVVSLLISLGMDTAGAQGVGSGWFLAGTPGGVPLVVTAAGDQWRYIPGFGWLNDLPNIFPGGASSSRTIIALVPTVGVNGSASAEAVTSDGEVWYNGGFPWTSAGVPPFANVSVSERDPGTMMLEASPNPADGTVLLGLGGRHGRVEVFDTTGRIVYRLAAANGAVRWDGNDEVGARVPGGVYFWRVVGAMGTGRLVVMR